jgi:L-ascorbate metabolism protein UlaG (beta-lactamase superfamily)
MKITKIGHCCLLVEVGGKRLLTDPGNYSTGQDKLTDIDAVIITHEHPDHLHMESLKNILANNPDAAVVSNEIVGALLDGGGIQYQKVEHGQSAIVSGIAVEGFGTAHAVIYPSFPPMGNTGYFIADRFFYPGDALTSPGKPVEVLALPVAGPWLKSSEAIDYAIDVNPIHCFPVHDAMLTSAAIGFYHSLPERVLKEKGIDFQSVIAGESLEFPD